MIQTLLETKTDQGLDQKLIPLSLNINFDINTKEVSNLILQYGVFSYGNNIEKMQIIDSPKWTNDNKRKVLDINGDELFEDYIDEDGMVQRKNIVEGEIEYWNRTIGTFILPAIQKTLDSFKIKYDNV